MYFIEAPREFPRASYPIPGVQAQVLMNDLEAGALKKVQCRLIPFLASLYFAAFIDRVNVGFAAQQMNRDLGFSAYVYGLGAGIFFIDYSLFEVPSNLILHRVAGSVLSTGIIAVLFGGRFARRAR